jgi:hypothetical protein
MKEELQQLRDLMFCYGYAEVPADDEKEFNKIWKRASERGWAITRQLFPDVEVFDEGIAILAQSRPSQTSKDQQGYFVSNPRVAHPHSESSTQISVDATGVAGLGTKPNGLNGMNDLVMILSEYWFDRIDAALAKL